MSTERFERAAALLEKAHSPFKRFSRLGAKSPAGRKGPDQRGDWSCSKKGKYVQRCIGVGPDTEGRVKIIRIKPKWKASYNADYKAGVASGAYKPGARSGGKYKKK